MLNHCKSGMIRSWLIIICVFGLHALADAQSDERRVITADPEYRLFQPTMVDEFGLSMRLEELLIEEYIDKETYVLGPGDMFSVDLQGEITQSVRGLVVNGEGNIFIPGVGQVEVKDMTLETAREQVNQQVENRFTNTQISLSLDRPRPVLVNVHGDVSNPGKYRVPFQTRVDQAIFPAITGEQASRSGRAEYQYSFTDLQEMPYSMRNIRVVSDDGSEQRADLMKYFRTGDQDANPFVSDGDVIHVQRTLEEGPRVSISGGVSVPLDFEYRQGDDLESLIEMAGGYSSDADTSEISLHRREDNEIVTHTFTPGSDDFSEIDIQANDKVVVPIDRDLHQSQTAHANGEIDMPGRYPIVEGETTLYDLLEMGGGATSGALEHGAYLIRSESSGDRSFKSPQPASEQLMRTSDQYRQGFEYLELEAALSRNQVHVDLDNEDQLKNTRLYSGDQLYIPKDENTVFMMGQVNAPGHYTFNGNSVENYIDEAGGYALAAEESRVFIIKAGSRSWYRPDETDLESGDIIFVDRVPYDDLQARRSYRQGNIQLILTGISTITSLITTYIAVFR